MGHSRRVKQSGCGADHPPISSAEVKERVELYFYSPSGPLWLVIVTFIFCIYIFNFIFIEILQILPACTEKYEGVK